MVKILEGWDGRFNVDSIQATSYSYSMLYFHKSLLKKYFDNETDRLKIVENHGFIDYFRKLMQDIDQGKVTQ